MMSIAHHNEEGFPMESQVGIGVIDGQVAEAGQDQPAPDAEGAGSMDQEQVQLEGETRIYMVMAIG